MKLAQIEDQVQTVVQPVQGIEPKDPQLEKDKERSLKQEEIRLLSQQLQNINDRIKLLQSVAQAIQPTIKPQNQFDNLERLEQDEQEEIQQQEMQDVQQQMLQQSQDQFKQQQVIMQQQQLTKQSWVHPEFADVEIKISDKLIKCDVAATPKQQASGLQTYDNLPRGRGLWFPMYARRVASFHMGDVQFPIDIVFIDGDKINKIVANIAPSQPGSWSSQCTDVIEVAGGWCMENGVSVGGKAITPLTSKRSRVEFERIINKFASAHNSYDPVRGITEADSGSIDPLEQEVLRLFPHLKIAQELSRPSTDRKPTIDNRNPQERFKGNDLPDVGSPEGQDNPNLSTGGDVSQQSSYGKNYHEQQGYDPATFREEDHPYAVRSSQRVQINSPSPDTELAGVIPEKLAHGSIQLYNRYKPEWNEIEDFRGYEKMAVIDDNLLSRWIDSLGWDNKPEATLRKVFFTDEFKRLLGSTLVSSGEAGSFDLLDSDLILYA